MNTTMTNPSTPKSEYMIFFRGADWDKDLSPDELQQALEKIAAWLDGLQQQGRVKGGQPLGDEVRKIPGRGLHTDGPFAEAKEAIGGYLVLLADSLDEAAALAEACPNLEYGVSIEVRPVLEICPVMERAKKHIALAAA